MKKCVALFAILILTLCGGAWAETAVNQFDEVWMTPQTLGRSVAFALDRDGVLYRWGYDETEPEEITTLPITNDAMFQDYSMPYPDLPAENRAQIDETVNLLAEDGETLYGINSFAGRIGRIDEAGIAWHAALGENDLLTDEGWERFVIDAATADGKAYLLLDYSEEAPNAFSNSRVMQIDLTNGATRLYGAVEGTGMCTYAEGLLLLCENELGCYLMTMNPDSGEFARLALDTPAGQTLAYDAQSNTIYLGLNEGIFAGTVGEPFVQVYNMPAPYVYGAGTPRRRYLASRQTVPLAVW